MISNNTGLNPSTTQRAYRSAFSDDVNRLARQPDGERVRGQGGNRPGANLTPEQQLELRELQQTDRKVRAHEMAHIAASGGLASTGATFSYRTGPDGQRYAVGGEVGIDTSKGRTPEETLAKAERIKAAALAPADPSPQDHKVAAMADRMAMQALTEIATREREHPTDQGQASPGRGTDVNNAYQRNATTATPGMKVNAYA